MRLGMIAPISHSYPPDGYGPWERVTHDLTERLVDLGVDVTLFSPADSTTRADLAATLPSSLETVPSQLHRELEDDHIRVALAESRRRKLDLIHSHLHVHVLDQARDEGPPIVTTLHGAAWNSEIRERLLEHRHRPFVSLSDRERSFAPDLNYVGTVPNGVRVADFPMGSGRGGYLAFVGRLAPEKAAHLAVEVAERTGHPLRVAGLIEEKHRDYAKTVLSAQVVDYLGELDRDQLSVLLRNATALLMPLAWDEPFGLVVVESMVTGTPVIAWRRGAMPEIVTGGLNGFLVDGVDGAVSAVDHVALIDRHECARVTRQRFSDQKMASGYAAIYESVIA